MASFGAGACAVTFDKKIMEYRGTLFAHGYFGHFISLLCLLFVFGFALIGEYSVAIGLFFLALIALVRLQSRRVVFTTDALRYDSWFASVTIPYVAISRVAPASSFVYPINRLHGGEFCIISGRKKYWVNFLWFPSSAYRDFQEHLVQSKARNTENVEPGDGANDCAGFVS